MFQSYNRGAYRHASVTPLARITIIAVLLFVSSSLFGANVTIPTFQLLTRGILEGGQFTLQTAGEVDINFGGGYKFGGQLSLALSENNLEEATQPAAAYDPDNIDALLNRSLRFRSASVIVRETFGWPINMTYFIGEQDRVLNGDLFPAEFGADAIASDFRGLLFFPTGVVYDGVHVVDGTGLSVSTSSAWQRVFLQGAIYQDAYLGAGNYSTDFRVAFNTPGFKVEGFAGASFPVGASLFGFPEFIYRGGVLMFYNTGQGGEFLAQIGVPRWLPATDGALDMGDFFVLFEPRVNINIISIVLTLFKHPESYEQQATDEGDAYDIFVRFIAGNIQENVVSGGLENGIRLRQGTSEQLRISVIPFLSINASGVIWDLRTDFKVLPFALEDLFTAYIGIRTEF